MMRATWRSTRASRSPVHEDSELLHALRGRYLRAARFTAPATVPTASLYAAILIPSANTAALLAWWLMTMVQLGTYWPVFFRPDLSGRWHRQALVAQVVGGAIWALLPVIAMPETTEWQMFVATMTLGVLASNAMFASSLQSLFLAFLVPFTSITFVGFILNTSGSVRLVTAGLVLYAAGFSAVLGNIRRADDVEAASLGIKNGRLAEHLAADRNALHRAAADLANVNDRLEYEATHDSLTGLARRPVFVEALRGALADEGAPGSVGVMFLDLDRFKFVNDSFGHTVGDALLQAVASRLEATLDPDETLARMGGDELVALVQLGSRRTAADSAARILDALVTPIVVADRPVAIGASVGIAVSDGSATATDLLRFADTALLRSKTDGRGRCTVFDAAMRLELDRRSHMAEELRRAVRTEQMTAHLQPIVELDSGVVVGGEALSRWNHETGIRSAGAYMDLASELGLEADISIGVIEAVAAFQYEHCRDLAGPWLTVNIPPQQLGQVFEHFRDRPEVLANLTLEITERGAVADLAQAQSLLSEARDAGARVFLDDFGVGQSSLSVLTDLPLDGIKIDAGFVRQLTISESARAVVETISDLGRRLDLAVIAEGVETTEQADRLHSLGITLVQGFLYSPPLPPDEFVTWCEGQARPAPAGPNEERS